MRLRLCALCVFAVILAGGRLWPKIEPTPNFNSVRPANPLLKNRPETGKIIAMLAIITLLIVLIVSILITRIATVALMHTGLSRSSARFQARSAFSGVGFTTHESEKAVNHPVRRRILLVLMLMGNAGIVTAISTLIVSYIDTGGSTSVWLKSFVLVTGCLVLWIIASSSWVDRRLSSLISKMLKEFTNLDIQDYERMLHLAGEYQIAEMYVDPSDRLANRALKDLNLRNEGVIVLGITRKNDDYIGAPFGQTVIKPYDTLILYGRAPSIERLNQRKKGTPGDIDHAREVNSHKQAMERENQDAPKN